MPEGMAVSLGARKGNPVYEYIKKEDIEAAFRDALVLAFTEITARIETLIALYGATAPPSLWTWDMTSRWGYDKFW